MKKTTPAIALILTLVFIDNINAQNNLETYRALPGINVTQIDGIDYVHREQKLHVKLGSLDNLPEFERFLEANGASVSRPFNRLNWGVVKLEKNVDLRAAIQILQENRFVEFAEPLVVAFPGSQSNDPDLHKQWYVRNTGQLPTGGTPGASAHFADAWMLTTGSSGVAVGILDSGIAMENGQLSHPDLQNTSRIIPRLNLVNPADNVRDNNGHGTFVAGIIGAEANNQVGISGVSPDSKLLIYKIGDTGSLTVDADQLQATIIDLDNWAVSTGDRVLLNYSYGTQNYSQALEDAVAFTNQKDILVVTPTHNDGQSNGIRDPAKFADQYSNVIAVGGTDRNDIRTAFSNYGPEITIAAPGGTSGGCNTASGIYSTLPGYEVHMTISIIANPFHCNHDNNYSFSVGTSWAAPQVAGAAALLLSMDSNLTPTEIRDLLTTSADKVGGYNYNWDPNKSGHSQELGHGRLNAFGAVKHALPNQYYYHYFSHFGTQSIGSAHMYGHTTLEFGTLSIPSGAISVIADDFYGFGSEWAKIEVEGRLIISANSFVSDVAIDVKNGGELIIVSYADLNYTPITVEDGGYMEVRDGAVISNGHVEIKNGGELQVSSGTTFTRVPFTVQAGGTANVQGGVFALGNSQWFTSYGKSDIQDASFSCASGSACNGILFQGSGVSGSSFENSSISGTQQGLTLLNASSISVDNSTFSSNANAGLSLISSNFLLIGDNNNFTLNGSHGLYADVSFGIVGTSNRFEQNQGDGIFAEGGSILWTNGSYGAPELVSTLNDGYGVRADYSSNILLDFYDSSLNDNVGDNSIYLNFTNEARATNFAVIEARKTWWGQFNPSSAQFETSSGGVIDWSDWLSNPVVMRALPPLAESSDENTEDPAISKILQDIAYKLRNTEDIQESLEELVASGNRIEMTTGTRLLASWLTSTQAWAERDLLKFTDRDFSGVSDKRYMERSQLYRYLALKEYDQANILLNNSKHLNDSDRVRFSSLINNNDIIDSDRVIEETTVAGVLSNYPNPFNPSTTITYIVSGESHIRMVVYDIIGREVQTLVNGSMPAGQHQIMFDGNGLASGIYIYRLDLSGEVHTGKMMLLK